MNTQNKVPLDFSSENQQNFSIGTPIEKNDISPLLSLSTQPLINDRQISSFDLSFGAFANQIWYPESVFQVVTPLDLPKGAISNLGFAGSSGLVGESPNFESKGVNLSELLVVPGSPDQTVTLKFGLGFSDAAYKNEVGFFLVDDYGRVNGVAPSQSEYAAQALTDPSRQTIFASGQPVGLTRSFTFRGGDRLAFYMIQNNTTEAWLSQNPNNRPIAFFSLNDANPFGFDQLKSRFMTDGTWQLAWEDLVNGGDLDYNDMIIRIASDNFNFAGILEKTPGESDQFISTRFFLTGRESFFNNELGLFFVDDQWGRIDNLNPEDSGYAQAALSASRRQVVFASGQKRGTTVDLELAGNSYFGLYLIQNGSTETFLSQNPNNQLEKGSLAFFSLNGLDPDKFAHLGRELSGTYVWEDLAFGGDQDFNDLVFRYEFREPDQPIQTPTIQIEDVTIVEGNSGITNAVFKVSLSSASPMPITVDFTTQDKTAIAGKDYQAVSGTLTFLPFEVNQIISVPIFGDDIDELDVVFAINLSNPVNATISDEQALGTILDDDESPTPIINASLANDTGVSNSV